MRKILVTTDLSESSKSGLRFAVHLASQMECELTFLHVYFFERPAQWRDDEFADFEKRKASELLAELSEFIGGVYKDMNSSPVNATFVLRSSYVVVSGITDYATKNGFDYICIGTRGAGTLTKVFGTNTSYLITHSQIPVIAVPTDYRPEQITNALYASDLRHLESELRRVKEFTAPLHATITLVHFKSPLDILIESEAVEKSKAANPDVTVYMEDVSPIETLLSDLEAAIEKIKPSLLVMFTEQNRTFFEKLFLSSTAAEFSFHPNVPLLVFKKE